MMRTLSILLFIVISIISSIAQKWEQTIGLPYRSETTYDVIEIYDKGVFIPANYIDGISGGLNIKTDVNGNKIYDKTIEHLLYSIEHISSVADSNGNIYICGVLVLDDVWPIISKYDSCGNNIWCRVYVNNYFDYGVAWDLLLIENNNILILVNQDMDDHIDQAVLYCLDNDGNLLWTDVYASKNDHPLIDNLVVYNLYQYNNSYFIDGYCYWAYPDDPSHFYLRPMFIKIDNLFNEEWVLPFGVNDSIIGIARGTIPLNDSVYLGIGERRSAATYNKNSLLMRFNKDGDQIGYHQIPNYDFGENVDFNMMSNIIQTSDTSFITKFYIGENDTVFHGETVIDTSGMIYCIKNQGPGIGTGEIIRTFDNNFLEAIEKEQSNGFSDIWLYKFNKNLQSVPFDTNTYVYDSLCPGGIQSSTIDITNCFIWTNIEDTPSPEEYYTSLKKIPIKAYPNPATQGSITFGFENTEHHTNIELKCFGIYGKEIYSEKVFRHQGKIVVDVSQWQDGMYVAVVYSDGLPVGNCKFVVQ